MAFRREWYNSQKKWVGPRECPATVRGKVRSIGINAIDLGQRLLVANKEAIV